MTDRDYETESVVTSVFIAIIVVFLSGAVITVVVYVIVKRFRKQRRKRITAASGEMTIQSPNTYSTASPSDAPTNFRERKVNNNYSYQWIFFIHKCIPEMSIFEIHIKES